MKKIHITLDGAALAVPAGTTLLEISRNEGLEIPTLCHLKGRSPSGSCLVCLVRERETGRLLPSCATVPREGGDFETSTPPVLAARRRSVELLLSEHVGECEAPCVRACPGGVDIPGMMRLIAAGRPAEACEVIRESVALPASLSWICPVSCERACRRSRHDGALSICLLKRHAAAEGLKSGPSFLPAGQEGRGPKVAVAGSGPAGLSAAWFLLRNGYRCTVLEKERVAGGILRSGGERPPGGVLDEEIEVIRLHGAEIRTGAALGKEVGIDELLRDFSAVIIATGTALPQDLERQFGVQVSQWGVSVDPRTFVTSRHRVFAAGDAVRRRNHPAVTAAQGRSAALAAHVLLSGEDVVPPVKRFSSVLGSISAGEMGEFLKEASSSAPVAPSTGEAYGLEDGRREASRCMHCDCRRKTDCRLREEAERAEAVQRRYAGESRAKVRRLTEHPAIVFEPGKCIRCGLCLKTAEDGERVGLSFLGKGMDMEVGVPFGEDLAAALGPKGAECANVCPTGAICLREGGKERGY